MTHLENDNARMAAGEVGTAEQTNANYINSELREALPASMRTARRWLLWRLIQNPDPEKKPRKVPYYLNGARRSGDLDSADDLARLGTFEDALIARASGGYTGLGFALGPDGTGMCWQGIDLDNISRRPALAELVADLPGYTETSPGGDGLHAIGHGLPFDAMGSNSSGIEAYSAGRFFTVTGESAGVGEPCDLSDFVNRTLRPMHGRENAAEAVPEGAGAEIVDAGTVRDLRSALTALNADDYDLWISIGHALKTLGDSGRAMWIEWSQTSAKWDPADAQRWATFKPTATGYAAVFAKAQAAGWLNPASKAAQLGDKPAEGRRPLLPFPSDLALADAFTKRATGQFRWTPGIEWMVNVGSHWERDLLLRRARLGKAVQADAARGLGDEQLRRKACSANTQTALISLSRSAVGIATAVSEWDKEPMLLNTPGGVFDLCTGQEVSRAGLLFTQLAGVAPDTKQAAPIWSSFLSEIFDGDLEMTGFIQRMAGYALTGSIREQKLFFLHGTGANGKSVFLDVLRNIGGSYSHNLPSRALTSGGGDEHPTLYASLHGKRMAISSEIEESAHWAESRIKELTGDETMTARYMRQDFFTFNVTHKHIIAGNFKPRLKGDDFAMARRLVLVPFAQRFEGSRRDSSLPSKLRAEYPAILAWAIEGARKWAGSGLAIPDAVVAASKAYMAEQNDIGLWLEESCLLDKAATTSVAALYESFRSWKDSSGEHAPSVKSFSQRLERMFDKRHTKQGRVFAGLALRPSAGDYAAASRGW